VFLEIAGKWTEAFYVQGPYAEPVVLAPVDAFLTEPETIAHELAHAISYYVFPEQHRWFSEGLAEFVQTLANRSAAIPSIALGSRIAHGSSGGGKVGDIPQGFNFADTATFLVDGAKLLKWNGAEDPATPWRYHVCSWLLYHWLWNTRGKALTAFQSQLMDGAAWDKAWLAAFPDLDPSKPEQMTVLEQELQNYRQHGHFVMAKVDAAAEYKTKTGRISAADVRLWLAYLRAEMPQTKEQRQAMWREQLEKARAEDPKNAYVLVRIGALNGKDDPAVARAAAEGAPKDFRGWEWLGNATTDPAEKEMAFRKAVVLEPECPMCNNNIAWFLALNGRAKEALPFANHAADLAPWSEGIIDTLAQVALQLGQCPQALQLQARATRLAGERRSVRSRQDYEKRLAEMHTRCDAKGAAPATVAH
jgi:Flp pilus assembly protein TadD